MNRRERIHALVDRDGDDAGELLVRSPAVGLYGFAPRVGEVLVSGSIAGRLSTLGRTVDLVLPAGATGRVAEAEELSARAAAIRETLAGNRA